MKNARFMTVTKSLLVQVHCNIPTKPTWIPTCLTMGRIMPMTKIPSSHLRRLPTTLHACRTLTPWLFLTPTWKILMMMGIRIGHTQDQKPCPARRVLMPNEFHKQVGSFTLSTILASPNGDLPDHRSRSPQFQSNPDPVQFVVKFPGAGEALEMLPLLGGHKRYANGLDAEESGPMEWAPFSTHREWEMAWWAKLRGPSSTALTELLEIDGAGRSTPIHSTEAKCHFLSFLKRSDCHLRLRRISTGSLTRNSQMDFHNLFGRRLSWGDRSTSFITTIYFNVFKPSTVTRSSWSVWLMPLNNTSLAQTRSHESSLR